MSRASLQGHRCEANLRVRRCSTTYLKWCQILFLITITASAVGFTSSISWCSSAIWIMVVSSLISLMMWTIKAPCYVCLWSPGYQCEAAPATAGPVIGCKRPLACLKQASAMWYVFAPRHWSACSETDGTLLAADVHLWSQGQAHCSGRLQHTLHHGPVV